MMNVSEIRQFLGSLAKGLRAAKASSAARDLERMCEGLQPFAGLTVSQFADFLAVAEEYKRTGIVPAKGGRGSKAAKAVDPQAVAEAVSGLLALYESAAAPATTYSLIDSEVKKVGARFTKPALVQVANGMGLAGSFKTKKAALDEIRRKITERKEAHERTQF